MSRYSSKISLNVTTNTVKVLSGCDHNCTGCYGCSNSCNTGCYGCSGSCTTGCLDSCRGGSKWSHCQSCN